MLQSAFPDCFAFDPFSLQEDGLGSTEVDVGGCEIVQALVVAVVIVVLARTWRFLRSTQAAETLKAAVCGGTGRSRYRNSIQPPFIVPGDRVKNGDEQLVVLNSIARSIIETVRGQHHDYVFTYRGQRVQRMLNSAEESSAASNRPAGSGPRSKAYVRSTPRRQLRGSPGFSRSPIA